MAKAKSDDGRVELEFSPIRGFPELRWAGKRPLRSLHHYPAQLRDRYGDAAPDGWRNRLYWGDNLQVMAHLLREFRGKVKLVYIDPPYDSKADYKKRSEVAGVTALGDRSLFEEKQYTDIWAQDEYLQFMYERLVVLRELLASDGTIYVQCDYRANSHLRLIMDEVFGPTNFRNEIAWCYTFPGRVSADFQRRHDTILRYSKSSEYRLNVDAVRIPYKAEFTAVRGPQGNVEYPEDDARARHELGKVPESWWADISNVSGWRSELVGYPTQKPMRLVERVVLASSEPGDIVFDAFMGSGTTQAVAMKLGRRFIGADINLGAINTTVTRLQRVAAELQPQQATLAGVRTAPTTGFEVYTVNNYDVFRNDVEARPLLMEALGISPAGQDPWHGVREGRMVRVMPINRIATRADLTDILHGINPKVWERRQAERPRDPAERITLVCMGHEPDLAQQLKRELEKLGAFTVDVEVVDVLRHGAKLEFKRSSEALVEVVKGELVIQSFYPMNLLQKLSIERERVESWRKLVESVQIDWAFDGSVFAPAVLDAPRGKGAEVKGRYAIPAHAKTARVRITDLISESWEGTVEVRR
jgi:DNA modification methylase